MDEATKLQVRQARRGFSAIALSYFMGLFNDNFYKEAALILAVTQNNSLVQSVAAGLFTVSYMLGAAPGGWWADRFPKGRVIVAAKAVEMLAMLVGAAGIWTGQWPLVLTMIALMGAQSAVFSPSMNGSIPELYPASYVQTANTIVRVLSTTAIFLGMALAGWLMDKRAPSWGGLPLGILWVGLFVIAAALIGFVVAFAAPRIQPHRTVNVRFPWDGPLASVREMARIRRDPLLAVCVAGNVYVWSLAGVMTLLMVNMGLNQFGLSATQTAGMKILFLVGVALGGVLSNVVARGEKFFRVLVPNYFAIGAILLLIGLAPLVAGGGARVWTVSVLIALAGVCGGVNLIPLESFIQVRPPPDARGRVIAAANFTAFAGLTLGAGLLYALNLFFTPTTSFGVLGAATIVFGAWLAPRLRAARPTSAAVMD